MNSSWFSQDNRENMTNAEIIQAIRNEIERLKSIGGIVPLDNREQKTGYESALIDVETFLSTLESEKPVPNDLEEAAKKHSCYDEDCEGAWYEPIVRNAFIAGAKWDRQQMMREAVEGVVCYGSKGAYIETDFLGEYNTDVYGNPGDKVRVIVCKKEE